MRRPSAAREALRLSPLVKAGRADASGVESVPLLAAGAEPLVFFPGRPAAERAADARAGCITLLLLFKFAIWNDDRIVCDLTHALSYDPPSNQRHNGWPLRIGFISKPCLLLVFNECQEKWAG